LVQRLSPGRSVMQEDETLRDSGQLPTSQYHWADPSPPLCLRETHEVQARNRFALPDESAHPSATISFEPRNTGVFKETLNLLTRNTDDGSRNRARLQAFIPGHLKLSPSD
jgi:hypothetical protein